MRSLRTSHFTVQYLNRPSVNALPVPYRKESYFLTILFQGRNGPHPLYQGQFLLRCLQRQIRQLTKPFFSLSINVCITSVVICHNTTHQISKSMQTVVAVILRRCLNDSRGRRFNTYSGPRSVSCVRIEIKVSFCQVCILRWIGHVKSVVADISFHCYRL